MAVNDPLVEDRLSGSWEKLDDAVKAFEDAWHTGQRPAIEDYLGATAVDSAALIFELAHVELERRLTAGEAVRVEEYLQRFPQLRNDVGRLVDLIATEYSLRSQRDTTCFLAEYLQRFPELAATLSDRLQATPRPEEGHPQPRPGPTSLSTAVSAPSQVAGPEALRSGPTGAQGQAPRGDETPGDETPGTDPYATRHDAGAVSPRAAAARAKSPRGYEILEILGQGGMGVVYKARQRSLNRLVALKLIKGGHAEQLRQEAEAVAQLQHPNIVQVFEVGEQHGHAFFSQELVDGGSLDKKLRGEPQDGPQAARDVEVLARAIHVAHQHRIVHRDLKPSNILCTRDGVLKIGDFGLAKQLDREDQTQSRAIKGTPPYMAPEQAEAGAVTPVTDVYALGAILYEMLTGRPPFKGKDVWGTLEQVRLQEPVPPRQLQPTVPRDLETICLKCLRKEPVRRYDSAAALADDLRRFLAGEPIHARSVGAVERAANWVRRRPLATACLAAAAVAAVSLFVGVFYYARFEAQQRRLLETALAEEGRTQRRLAGLRLEGQESFAAGKAALERGELEDARAELIKAQGRVGAEPALHDLQARVGALLDRTQARLQTRLRRQQLKDLHDTVLFYSARVSGADAAANVRKVRAAAGAALALFPAADAAALTAAEKQEVQDRSYLMHLLLAEALAVPLADEEIGQQTRQALRQLDLARGLRRPTHAYHLRRARYLARQSDAPAARRERALADALPPADDLDFFLQGEDALQHHDLPQAIRDFTAALQRNPNHFWARYLLAVCYMRPPQPRYDLARDHLTACVGQDPRFAWTYLLRGVVHGQLADYAAAEADFAAALQRQPDADARYGLYVNRSSVRLAQARELAVDDLAAITAFLPEAAPVRAGILVARRQRQVLLDMAIHDLQQAIACNPDHFQAYVNLAQAEQMQGAWARARARLGTAIAKHPRRALLYRERAEVFLRENDVSRAIADLRRAIDLEPAASPQRATDFLKIAHLRFRAGAFDDALRAAQDALQGPARPADRARAHLLRADVRIKQRQYLEALVELDSAEQLGPRSAAFYRTRGLVRAKLGKHGGAVDDYTRALALRPEPATYLDRGWAYLLAFRAPRLALADFDEALRRDPGNAEGYLGRANARVQLGPYPAAIADLTEALRRAAPSGRLHYAAARVFAQAVGQLRVGPAKYDPSNLRTQRRYEERALTLLGQAIAARPYGERAAFFRETIDRDLAFAALWETPGYRQLAAEFAPRQTAAGK